MSSAFRDNWIVRRFIRQLTWLSFCSLLLISHRANACITVGDFDLNLITQSDAIYVGTVNKFEIVNYEDVFGNNLEYGLIDFSIKKTLKGEGHGDLKLFLPPDNFGIPQEIMVSKSLLMGNSAIIATNGRSIHQNPTLQQRFENGAILNHQPPILPKIASAPCSRDFILPFSPELETAVRGSLRGKAIKDADEVIYARPSETIGIIGKSKIHTSIIINPVILSIFTFLLIFTIGLTSIFTILRRIKKRRSFKTKS